LTAVVVSVVGAYGVFLIYTAALGDAGRRSESPTQWSRRRHLARDWLTQAGLADVRPLEFVLVVGVFGVVGAAIGFVVFAGVLPAAVLGAFVATSPVAWYRGQRARRRAESQDAWPRMIEELRLLTGSLGRSVPQALFEVGRAAPTELRGGFAAAQREWLLSTDFERALKVLKAALADDTADVVAETLLVGYELGGSDLERRLRSLADDRILDLQHRKDARAHQAGVRFVRRFVLVVPFGMAMAGMTVGNGRAAYRSDLGQTAVVVAIGMVIACWIWAGRLLRLPELERVFATGADDALATSGGGGPRR
jgi:tight adherence protein B